MTPNAPPPPYTPPSGPWYAAPPPAYAPPPQGYYGWVPPYTVSETSILLVGTILLKVDLHKKMQFKLNLY